MSTTWLQLLDCPFQVRFPQARGVTTRILDAGTGAPLMFLHGMGGHLEAYSRNVRSHAAHFRVLAPDFIGHGFSDKPDLAYEIPAYAGHILDLMDSMGLDKANFSGASLGGWVAAWIAARFPERVNKLVLNTAGGFDIDQSVMERIKRLSMESVTNPTRDSVKKRLELIMAHPQSVTEELVDIRFQIYSQPGMIHTMENIMCLESMEVRRRNLLAPELLRKITASTLVIWTTNDPIFPVEVGRRFTQYIPDCRFALMEDCGHWPQFEKADEFNRVHLEFLLPS
jgi:2-hydroxy-6-oxonona-2,4-dienedioate hydrolase